MRIKLKIDVTKLPRERIIPNSYKKKSGEQVNEKNIDLEVVEKKEPRHIQAYGDSDLYETHFVKIAQTKEERERKDQDIFVGSGTQFIKRTGQAGNPDDQGYRDQPAQQQSGGAGGGFNDFDDPIPFNRLGREHNF